jgi:hypothetical protein
MYNITLSVVKLAIATNHAMQVFNDFIIQIDAGLLAWHAQLAWRAQLARHAQLAW